MNIYTVSPPRPRHSLTSGTIVACLVIFLVSCGGGGSSDTVRPVTMRPEPTPEPGQSQEFSPTCTNGRCTANYGGRTLQAQSNPAGRSGSAFQDFYGPLPEGGTASYEGVAAFRRNPRTAQASDEYGAVTLTADFGASTIGGSIDGKDGSPVQLTLNPASPLPNGSFTYFEASPRNPSPAGGPAVTCRAGVTCDGGQWWGEFGHEDTVGATFLAEQSGQRHSHILCLKAD